MALLAPQRVTALAVLGSSAEAEDPQAAAEGPSGTTRDEMVAVYHVA